MAKAGYAKQTETTKITYNENFKTGDRVEVITNGFGGVKTYIGTVNSKWSNFGLWVILDGQKTDTLYNLAYDKITLI